MGALDLAVRTGDLSAIVEAFDEHAHPRGRGGKWAHVIGKIDDVLKHDAPSGPDTGRNDLMSAMSKLQEAEQHDRLGATGRHDHAVTQAGQMLASAHKAFERHGTREAAQQRITKPTHFKASGKGDTTRLEEARRMLMSGAPAPGGAAGSPGSPAEPMVEDHSAAVKKLHADVGKMKPGGKVTSGDVIVHRHPSGYAVKPKDMPARRTSSASNAAADAALASGRSMHPESIGGPRETSLTIEQAYGRKDPSVELPKAAGASMPSGSDPKAWDAFIAAAPDSSTASDRMELARSRGIDFGAMGRRQETRHAADRKMMSDSELIANYRRMHGKDPTPAQIAKLTKRNHPKGKVQEAASAVPMSNAARRPGESLTSWGNRLKAGDSRLAASAKARKGRSGKAASAGAAAGRAGAYDETKHRRGRGGKFTFSKGAQGAEVRGIQRRVGARVDGQFGDLTAAAVRGYQRRHNLVVDGVVGSQTVAALRGAKKIHAVGGLSVRDRRFLAGHPANRG